MKKVAPDMLSHPNTKQIYKNKSFALYLFSGLFSEDLELSFISDQLAIFVCLTGEMLSKTPSLSYHLTESLVSFALTHRCSKIIPANTKTEIIILTFKQEALENLIKSTGENVALTMSHFTSCQCTVNNCNSEIQNLTRKLLKETTEKYWGFELNSELAFKELLIAFVRLFTSNNPESKKDPIKDTQQYLTKNFKQKLDLDLLANEMGFSKSHLCRVFKKSTGQTISQFLNKIRIEKACKKLSSTNTSMEEIALNCGFNNPSYFYRVFKKVTGKLPLEWKKSYSIAESLSE